MKRERAKTDSATLQKIIIEQIESGELLPGEKIWSERTMAEMYDVSRSTAQYALQKLEERGYIYRVAGSGSFVREHALSRMDLSYLNESGDSGITAMLTNMGAKISNIVLACGKIEEECFLRKLGLESDDEVFVIHRVRLANDEPFAVEYSYIPSKMFPDADEHDFGTVSLYDYMNRCGHLPVDFNQRFQIEEVGKRERQHLMLQRSEPVYHFEYTGFDSKGNLVEYTESYARCDKTEVHFDTKVI